MIASVQRVVYIDRAEDNKIGHTHKSNPLFRDFCDTPSCNLVLASHVTIPVRMGGWFVLIVSR